MLLVLKPHFGYHRPSQQVGWAISVSGIWQQRSQNFKGLYHWMFCGPCAILEQRLSLSLEQDNIKSSLELYYSKWQLNWTTQLISLRVCSSQLYIFSIAWYFLKQQSPCKNKCLVTANQFVLFYNLPHNYFPRNKCKIPWCYYISDIVTPIAYEIFRNVL